MPLQGEPQASTPSGINLKKGLIVIDHDGPGAEDLPPEAGVGGFSRAAGGGKEVGPAVHSHGAAMEEQGIVGQKRLGHFSLDDRPLQERGGESAFFQAFFLSLPVKAGLFVDQIRF